MTSTFEIIEGDCLAVMPTLAAGSVDAVITDMPYGTTACPWDSVIPLETLWKEYRRLLKDNGAAVLTAAQPFTSALLLSNREWFRYDLTWDKRMPVGHLNAKKMPLRQHEDVLIFSPATLGNFTYNPIMRQGVYRGKGGPGVSGGCYGKHGLRRAWNDQYYPTSIIAPTTETQITKEHPTQKPVALMQFLVLTYTNPGDTVLDSCCGSGTTGVACVNTDRNFIGIEKDAGYAQIARRRITQAAAQGRLELV